MSELHEPMDIFDNIVSRRDVALAAISTLQTWLPSYLAEIERTRLLNTQTIPLPPDPDLSYKSALDWDTWTAGAEPCILVQAKPEGTPERYGGGVYTQTFNVLVASVVQAEDEDAAQEIADYYGAAVMAAILQNGALGGLATKTVLFSFPNAEFVAPDVFQRRICRSVVGFRSVIENVVTEISGPETPPESIYVPPGVIPTVQPPIDITFDFVQLDQPL